MAASPPPIVRKTVDGRIEFACNLAGVDGDGAARNADARMGPVSVGGDSIASSPADGAVPGADRLLGSADNGKAAGAVVKHDPLAFLWIARLAIGSQILETVGRTDHFGLVAEAVGTVTIGGARIPTAAGAVNDDLPVGLTGDFRVPEV